MINIKLDKKSQCSVLLKVYFTDIYKHVFYKNVLNKYCIEKKIENIPINAKWENNSFISKLLNRNPMFNISIYPKTYKSQFGILNLLFEGNLYKFNSEEEADTFIEGSKKVVTNFIKEDFDKFIKPTLNNFYKWDMNKDERTLLDDVMCQEKLTF